MKIASGVLLTLAVCLAIAIPTRAEDGKIYWTERNVGLIKRANLDGTGIETVLSSLVNPDGIAVDGVGEFIYWLEQGPQQGDGKLRRSKLDGSNIVDLVTDLEFPISIVLDVATSQLYYTDAVDDLILRCNTDGSNNQIVLPGVLFPFGIGLDISGGKMYWTTDGENRIRRANLDGSNVEDLVSAGVLSPFGLTVDTVNGHVYWCDQAPGRVQRANLDGSDVQVIVGSSLVAPFGIKLDVANARIYWASVTLGIIYRAGFDGSNIEQIITGLTTSRQIALDLTPLGACCRGVLGCQRRKQHQCDALAGAYLGDGTQCLPANTCGDAETDQCAVAGGAPDCQPDGVPDVCQLTSNDCQPDGIPDQCQTSGNDLIPTGGDDAPDECNTPCVTVAECPSGFFCIASLCQNACLITSDCGDISVCTYDDCIVGHCQSTAVNYGDVNGSGGIANLDDILCVLRGFATYTQCPNADLSPSCTGNDIVNLDDILLVLTAFAGVNPCGC